MFASGLTLRKRLQVSLFLTLLIVSVELFGGILSNSISLVSDAGHVFTDALAIALSLLAVILATKPHSGSMTFGYHRAEVLSALANGITLAAISIWIIFEAYQRILSPGRIDAFLTLVVAVVGLSGNMVIIFILKSHADSSLNVKSAFVHVIYDAISSIVVIVSSIVAYYTFVYTIDAIAAILIAGLIARSGYEIVRESAHILLEGAPVEVNVEEIIDYIKQIDNMVTDVHDLHVWTISSGMHALSGHIVVPDQLLSQSTTLIHKVNRMLNHRFNISHTTLQIEPERKASFKRGV